MRLLNNLLIALNIVIFCFTGVQCSRIVEFHYKLVDEPLVPYVNEYKGLLDKYCKNKVYNQSPHYMIELSDELESEDDIGVCYRKLNGFHIKIKNKWWQANTDPDDRRELMFHELAHCFINQDHVNNPNNYMNPFFPYLTPDVYMPQAIEDIKAACK